MIHKQSKILLITTNLILSEKIDKVLQEMNFDYLLYVSGLTYYNNIINSHDIDLILADYSSAEDILEVLKFNDFIEIHETPIIAVLAPGREDLIPLVVEANVADYIYEDRLKRLSLTILREIKASKIRKEHKILINELQKEPNNIISLLEIDSKEYSNRKIMDSAILFFRLFHSIPIGISLVSAATNEILDINDGYLNLLELDRTDILGKNSIDLNLWKFPRERDSIINFISKYGAIKNQEVTLVTKSQKDKIVLMSAIYLPQDEFPESTYLFMGIDITDRKKMEDEIIKALEKEVNLSILKSRFISMISHEFRTPLTTIMLSTDLLKNYGQNWSLDEKDKHYQRIKDTILSLIQLLENVIIIGKIDTSEYSSNLEDIDLPSFFRSSADYAISSLSSASKISVQIEGDISNLLVDENLLSQILNNLFANSIKYSEEGSTIWLIVKIDRINNIMILSIKDKGIGIPEEEFENVFESFYRAANVGNKSGFGLGLTIVKRCVDQLKGKIKIESKLNEFTNVIISLPLVEYKNQ